MGKKAKVKKAGKQPGTKVAAKGIVTEPAGGKKEKALRPTLRDLKRQVRETWPEVKNLADARRSDLVALIERGDAELFQECQNKWKGQAMARHNAWLKGGSKSAQALREKIKPA